MSDVVMSVVTFHALAALLAFGYCVFSVLKAMQRR